MTHELSRSFGYQAVTPEERRARVRRVFTAVAPRYDLMNDLMSLGIHRLWKRTFARMAAPQAGQVIVDVAGGTGDIARLLAGPARRVTVCDPSLPMMTAGRRHGSVGIEWVAGEAESIPLADNSVDTVTIAFGIRNATHLDRALAEMARVLKPGGRLLCLEFSRPVAPLRPFYTAFSYTAIPALGAIVARNPEAYVYLVESIRRFPAQHAFKAMFEAAGLVDVRFRNLSFGIACIHEGTKPG
ncbi:MAG TPA: class I SAM-dependent methyltransferase [Azospirillum sp.]|nr:class I SAM-dependent methyltransferase [Azospirillum sp.]